MDFHFKAQYIHSKLYMNIHLGLFLKPKPQMALLELRYLFMMANLKHTLLLLIDKYLLDNLAIHYEWKYLNSYWLLFTLSLQGQMLMVMGLKTSYQLMMNHTTLTCNTRKAFRNNLFNLMMNNHNSISSKIIYCMLLMESIHNTNSLRTMLSILTMNLFKYM